jgi:hypothetical protein
MSTPEEFGIAERVPERPSLELGAAREVRSRDLAIRFVTGAITSVVSGALTLALGARVGGIFLAFPAILAASLTLIAKQEDSAEAREDARGAVIGGFGMAVFAAVAALGFGHLPGAVVLVLAALAWLTTALLGYVIAWFR